MINYSIRQVDNYQFFDGEKKNEVQGSYDEFLTSGYYESLLKAYVVINGQLINLLHNRKSISSFQGSYFSEEDIIKMAGMFNMEIKKNASDSYLVKSTRDGYFELSENESYVVIFCVENYKEPEHIFIYGVWEKIYNANT